MWRLFRFEWGRTREGATWVLGRCLLGSRSVALECFGPAAKDCTEATCRTAAEETGAAIGQVRSVGLLYRDVVVLGAALVRLNAVCGVRVVGGVAGK